MVVHMDDADSTDTQLWRHVLDQLLAGGASPAEALEGANLLLGAYVRGGRPVPSARGAPEHEPRGKE
jgi:hypothetical protein